MEGRSIQKFDMSINLQQKSMLSQKNDIIQQKKKEKQALIGSVASWEEQERNDDAP